MFHIILWWHCQISEAPWNAAISSDFFPLFFFSLHFVQIDSLERLGVEPNCETVCGDAGCQCLTNMYPLDQVDHLMMLTEDGQSVNCFCGAFRSEWLPVSLRTWTPVKLVYSIPHYSWSTKGFSFKSSYGFNNDALCGSKTFTTHNGKKNKTLFHTTAAAGGVVIILFLFVVIFCLMSLTIFSMLPGVVVVAVFIVLLLWHKSLLWKPK